MTNRIADTVGNYVFGYQWDRPPPDLPIPLAIRRTASERWVWPCPNILRDERNRCSGAWFQRVSQPISLARLVSGEKKIGLAEKSRYDPP